MTIIEGKSAYPYLTIFKKEPFESYILIKSSNINEFYSSNIDKINIFYKYIKSNLFTYENLNLENIFWFLLLRKYLKKKDEVNKKQIYDYITRCEVIKENTLGFKFNPDSEQFPDIWSTYYALMSLFLLGILEEFLFSHGLEQSKAYIKDFIFAHIKENRFLHCLDERCEIEKKISPARTLYFILEILSLLDMDIRTSREKFRPFVGVRKKDSSIVFKLSCLLFLDLSKEAKEKEIQYVYQFQRKNGGFSFRNGMGNINATFWVVWVLHNYNWFIDYDPSSIYSFCINKINGIINQEGDWNLTDLTDVSKLTIILSLIWKKFIDEIERIIFKELERKNYINLNRIQDIFGLDNTIKEVITYINLNYNFNLKILTLKNEFTNFVNNLDSKKKLLATIIYEEISENIYISLSDILKKYNMKFRSEHLKIKDLENLLNEMISHHFFEGTVKKKRAFMVKTKYYFYLDNLPDNIIISDTKINAELLYQEKLKLKEIKNDIYNMTLSLKNATSQIKEEIESYLLMDEVDYAKKRLNLITRTTLMEADFLNENIENSFNEQLYYINMKAVLANEISLWNDLYSILSKKLNETEKYLKEKIQEKEELKKYEIILNKLEDRIFAAGEAFNKRIKDFRAFLRDLLEGDYKENTYDLMIREFEDLKSNVDFFDEKIHFISQKITSREETIKKKHKKVIENWIGIKEELSNIFLYYSSGFSFFKDIIEQIEQVKQELKQELAVISEQADQEINKNEFKKAFELIQTESDLVLKEKSEKIKDLKNIVKKEIKEKQKLYLLYRHLQENLDKLEENNFKIVGDQVQYLRDKIIEERNRSKIDDFEDFASEKIIELRKLLNDFKININDRKRVMNLEIKEEFKKLADIQNKFESLDKKYLKKLENCRKIINNFDEKSKVTIIQWTSFKTFFENEVSLLKDDLIDEIITTKIHYLSDKNNSNNINIKDLKKETTLSCNILMEKIKTLIDFSKIEGKLFEDEKRLLIFSESYFINKELRYYVDNKLLKESQEKVGKLLALYDSAVRKKTLHVNLLEIQNRLNDLETFDQEIKVKFDKKARLLEINVLSRKEYVQTKEYFENVIQNQKQAIDQIKRDINFFRNSQNLISNRLEELKLGLNKLNSKIIDEIEKSKSYSKIREHYEELNAKFETSLIESDQILEKEIKEILNGTEETRKLTPELQGLRVNSKNQLFEEFNNIKEKLEEKILILKNELLRGKLLNTINDSKIYLSQLLGNLQKRVEDNLEIKEFKRAYVIVQKRVKNIEQELKEIIKKINNIVKNYNKESLGFESRNKYILDNFEQFLNEYDSILIEKVKSLERAVVQEYVSMSIKAVSNQYLTIGFLNHELKIKKQNLQDHLLFLISSGQLSGKYDPRIGLYYENPDVIKNLDEEELEVIKNMNFRIYMFLTRLKNFTGQYYSIIAFFASFLTISYYLFTLTGGNPFAIFIPLSILIVLLSYLFFKKRKEGKIKL